MHSYSSHSELMGRLWLIWSVNGLIWLINGIERWEGAYIVFEGYLNIYSIIKFSEKLLDIFLFNIPHSSFFWLTASLVWNSFPFMFTNLSPFLCSRPCLRHIHFILPLLNFSLSDEEKVLYVWGLLLKKALYKMHFAHLFWPSVIYHIRCSSLSIENA